MIRFQQRSSFPSLYYSVGCKKNQGIYDQLIRVLFLLNQSLIHFISPLLVAWNKNVLYAWINKTGMAKEGHFGLTSK